MSHPHIVKPIPIPGFLPHFWPKFSIPPIAEKSHPPVMKEEGRGWLHTMSGLLVFCMILQKRHVWEKYGSVMI